MKTLLLGTLLCFLASRPNLQASVTMVWASEVGLPAWQSDGITAFTSDFAADLGVFSPGFVPDATNLHSWEANWSSFGSTPYNTTDQYFSGKVTVDSNALAPAGSLMYVWLRGPIKPDGKREWYIATNNSGDGNSSDDWLMPNVAGTDQTTRPVYFDLITQGMPTTTNGVLFGSTSETEGLGENTGSPTGSFVQTYVYEPVPEPSVTILGLLAVLGLQTRRNRRSF